jgi:hypothetical protein
MFSRHTSRSTYNKNNKNNNINTIAITYNYNLHHVDKVNTIPVIIYPIKDTIADILYI